MTDNRAPRNRVEVTMPKLTRWLPLAVLIMHAPVPATMAAEASTAPTVEPLVPTTPAEPRPDEPGTLSIEAIDLAMAGDGEAADAVIERARMLAPDDPVVFARHAVVDLYLGRPREALDKLEVLLENGIVSADLMFNRSLALRALGRYEAAQQAYVAFVSIRDGAPSAGPPAPAYTAPLNLPPAAPADPQRPGP